MSDTGIRVRAYNVGFGDCFLLTFPDGDVTRNMLIDFGCAPKQSRFAFERIAKNIFEQTGGHLDVVVLSHEHVDHVCGFLSQREIFDQFTVDYVWMGLPSQPKFYEQGEAKVIGRIRALAESYHAEIQRENTKVAKSFESLLLNNIGLKGQINYVRELPQEKDHVLYLKRGDSVLGKPFTNQVSVEVLAPQDCVSCYFDDNDEDNYDLISDLGSIANRLEDRLLAKYKSQHAMFPSKDYKNVKCVDHPVNLAPRDWRLLRKKNQSFGVPEIRALDCAVNNTSLMLLLKINGKSLLFPGDAEISSWYWTHYCDGCLELNYDVEDCPGCLTRREALGSVDFIKLPQHGSKSGAPRETIDKLKPEATIMVSTKPGVYGTKNSIPDESLLKALKAKHGKRLVNTSDYPEKLWVDANL